MPVKWSNSPDPDDAATFGTGANPTDFTSANGGRVYLHVTCQGRTVTKSFPVRPGPGYNPAALFASGEQGGWWDPSDLSTMWKDTAGTDPVTADGDAVARIDDKSGNGNHLTQATLAERPLYKTSGGLHWLEFDGSNDRLSVSKTVTLGSGAGWSVFSAQRELTRTTGCVYSLGNTGAGRLTAAIPYSDGVAYFDAGGTSGVARISGAWVAVGTDTVTTQQRAQSTNAYSVFRNGSSFGTPTTNGANISGTEYAMGDFNAAGFGHFAGRIYGLIFVEADKSAQRADVEGYLASKAGVTL